MTRLLRMVLPISLCALITSAIILACGGGSSGPGDMPTVPRPEPIDPSGQPLPAAHPVDPATTLNDARAAGTPTPGSPLTSALSGSRHPGVAPELLLAAQPAALPPGGSQPQPGAPSPGAPPQPGTPPPGSPPPGSPPAAPSPSQPAPRPPGSPSQPAPGSPSQPAPGAPGDAGVSDAVSLPPVPDGNLPRDSGMEPILRRD